MAPLPVAFSCRKLDVESWHVLFCSHCDISKILVWIVQATGLTPVSENNDRG